MSIRCAQGVSRCHFKPDVSTLGMAPLRLRDEQRMLTKLKGGGGAAAAGPHFQVPSSVNARKKIHAMATAAAWKGESTTCSTTGEDDRLGLNGCVHGRHEG